jgi:hypothetical protein
MPLGVGMFFFLYKELCTVQLLTIGNLCFKVQKVIVKLSAWEN